METMFSLQPIGYVRSPYADTHEIPKGLGAKHEAEGVLEIRAEFEPGLTDLGEELAPRGATRRCHTG